MLFEYRFVADAQWSSKIHDPVNLIRCLPGLKRATETADGGFALAVGSRLGPVRLDFEGTAQVEQRQPQWWRAVVVLKERMAGTVYGTFDLFGLPQSEVKIQAEVNLEGRLAEFAQPLVKRKVQEIFGEFQENFVRMAAALSEKTVYGKDG
ncbi:MAG: SRPBCC domain-containing protein [Firmicutes bacterium]|nr:SRPBCC domain-containing protein [Bacillota bacterium]